ncbi:MAG TPA: ABC transporter substrate-binding protein [Candidatus Binatia bacterium]|nr:ABC transporter substrate-binding protein [Candidatus Binatia bacterium]
MKIVGHHSSEISKSIFRLALFAVLFALCFPVQAQQAAKVYRIGMLINGTPSSHKFMVDEFQQGLRDLGYVEGKTFLIEVRYAEGKLDRLPELARELAQMNIEVILTNATPGTVAMKQATSTIPIVFTGVGDPVKAGLVKSFAKPGGNLTGISILSPDLGGKRLELLQEAIPGIARVAVLWSPSASTAAALKTTRAAAEALGLQLQSLEVRNPNDFSGVTDAILKRRPGAILTNPSPVLSTIRTQVIEFATKNRLPAMYANLQFVEAGGLMAYAHSSVDAYRRAAVYVDKILKGTRPADLPVELPTKLEFIINLKAAKQIGLTIPPNVLARADRVIK